MKIKNPFSALTKFEWGLYIFSLSIVALSFILSPERDVLNLIASLVGVTGLIFVARGAVFGQAVLIVFALLYALTSYREGYYGEMITYLGMSAPAAAFACISWLKNPYGKRDEVKVGSLDRKKALIMIALTVSMTVAFYFILSALGTENLPVSTLSVATSVLAAYMTFIRVPYYALGYVLNDVVLIVLWCGSAFRDVSYLPVVMCFFAFLFNDLYGFVAWKRREIIQRQGK